MINEKFTIKTARQYELHQYSNNYMIILEETIYENGNYAIAMYSLSEDRSYWEPWDVLTKNLQESRGDKCAYVQTDKYLDFVLKNSIGTPTGNSVKNGYNHYTEIKFAI